MVTLAAAQQLQAVARGLIAMGQPAHECARRTGPERARTLAAETARVPAEHAALASANATGCRTADVAQRVLMLLRALGVARGPAPQSRTTAGTAPEMPHSVAACSDSI